MPRGVEKTAKVNGTVLRRLLAERGVSQRDLAKEVGLTHYRVSSIAKVGGVNNVRLTAAKKIAKMLNSSLEQLAGNEVVASSLNDDETAVLEMYKRLDIIQRAEALLKMKAMLDKNETNQ